MQENESYAVALRQRHKEVVDRLTSSHHGTIIQYYGDGTLSIFDHSLDAVQCALCMQREFLESPKIPLRIGINTGEILLGPDGVYGDTVNIASRIERMSVPGSVLISDRVFSEIHAAGGVQTKELGSFELKNVRYPVSIHAVIAEGVVIPDPVELQGKMGYKEKSILVLPFNNLSKDPQHDAFTDEMTEQIITALSQTEGIRVTSRTSSFAFKDKVFNLRHLHQELGVDYVLEGSIRIHGNKARITAQLIHAANDFHLWSETYQREVTDVFEVQDEIASNISIKLKASFQKNKMTGQQDQEEDASQPSDAFDHHQQGRFHWKQMQPGYLDTAIQHFRKALEIDATYYPAWPSLAVAYAYKGYYNQLMPAEAARFCQSCLDEAQRIDADHIRTHVASAFYHLFFTWDWRAVVRHIEASMHQQEQDGFLSQNTLQQLAGLYHMIAGRLDAAIECFKKALKPDPLSVNVQMELARAYLYKRDFGAALQTIDLVVRNKPDFIPAHEAKGWILFNAGQQREGIALFEASRKQSTFPVTGMAGLAYAYSRTSQAKRAREIREEMASLHQDLPRYAPHIDMAVAHLGAQEYKPMFSHLAQAAQIRMPSVLFLEANPIFDEIRRFKEYRELVKSIFGENQRPPL